MNVLSLFDGMSCGQISLTELGFKINKYYASEIEKAAIKVSSTKFPNTIHLGSVINIDISKLEPIDLLIGGSPCTNLSFAGVYCVVTAGKKNLGFSKHITEEKKKFFKEF